MVKTGLALSILQLVALSLPAFAIILQLIGESDIPYANEAVPVVAASFAAITGSGAVITGTMVLQDHTLAMQASLLRVTVGLVGLIAGVILVSLRTRREQQSLAD